MTETTLTTVVWMFIAGATVFCLYYIGSALGAIAGALWPICEAVKTLMDELREAQRDEAGDLPRRPLLIIMRMLWSRIA